MPSQAEFLFFSSMLKSAFQQRSANNAVQTAQRQHLRTKLL